jgi:hypothetical protein
MSKRMMPKMLALGVALMTATAVPASAKHKNSPKPITITKPVDTASPSVAARKLPGKKKPPTLTLKRGRTAN